MLEIQPVGGCIVREKHTAEVWNSQPDRRFTVIDPDGWDRSNWAESGWHTELITFQEFMKKAMRSTIIGILGAPQEIGR